MKPLIFTLTAAALLTSHNLVNAECNVMLQMHAPAANQTVDAKTNTVIDNGAALMWMRCPLGYSLENNSCSNNAEMPSAFTWEQALAAADTASHAGFNDWRLPNRKELDTIVNRNCFEPANNELFFPATATQNFWTNSPYPFNSQSAWGIEFEFGSHKSLPKSGEYAARLVRGL